MNRQARIITILQQQFNPILLEVNDDSEKHRGHASASPSGETHYSVIIEAETFRGLSRVAAHQAIYNALKPELDSGLHALAITARAPAN